MADLDEAINLVGISSFINADGGADVREIERSLVEQTEQLTIKDVDEDVVAEFKRRIASMESAVGMSLSGTTANDPGEEDDVADEAGDEHVPQPVAPPQPARYQEPAIPSSRQAMYTDPGLVSMSNEQRRQRILQSALSNINTHSMADDDHFNLDIEKENDTKDLLLNQIDMLRTNLEDDDIKISDVRVVTSENTLDEVKRVFDQLRYRNDHARYCGFAKELAEVGAYGLEWAFDGKKNYFGLRPDLTGWGATLNIKMRRLRYETSRLVSDGMAAYDLGNFPRLCLELIPSMIIHSRMRSNKAGAAKSRPSDAEVASAIDKIRDKQTAKRDQS